MAEPQTISTELRRKEQLRKELVGIESCFQKLYNDAVAKKPPTIAPLHKDPRLLKWLGKLEASKDKDVDEGKDRSKSGDIDAAVQFLVLKPDHGASGTAVAHFIKDKCPPNTIGVSDAFQRLTLGKDTATTPKSTDRGITLGIFFEKDKVPNSGSKNYLIKTLASHLSEKVGDRCVEVLGLAEKGDPDVEYLIWSQVFQHMIFAYLLEDPGRHDERNLCVVIYGIGHYEHEEEAVELFETLWGAKGLVEKEVKNRAKARDSDQGGGADASKGWGTLRVLFAGPGTMHVVRAACENLLAEPVGELKDKAL